MNYRMIFRLTMWAAKKRLSREKGEGFYTGLYKKTEEILSAIAAAVPDIAGSLFYFNYQFGVCYVAWFKALSLLGYDESSAIQELWTLTEDFLHFVPQPIMHIAAKPYLNNWRRRAPAFEAKGKAGELHPFDYRIQFVPVDENTFGLDFYECAMKKLFEKLGVPELMPGICRIDYLMFNYMGVGFERTKTLGDGDDCCNCRYSIKGHCEWAPEKGFTNRK